MNIQNHNYPGITQYQMPQYNFSPSGNYSGTLSFNNRYNLMTDTVSFSGKAEKKRGKKIEETLKNIDGLHDPYSDVIMISQRKFQNLQNKIHKRSSAESMNNLMNGYTQHMFPSEQEVFALLKQGTSDYKKRNRSCTYTDILQDNLPEAKTRLINAQLDIVDEMKETARRNLPKPELVKVYDCLGIIEDDVLNDQFRIKASREMIRELADQVSHKETVAKLVKLSDRFPNTATNSDAFIVKYANKSQDEIAELLVSPAQISIEHIKPQSVRGEDKGENYLAASKRMNNYRSSTPLDEMIERYPDIPKQTQRYMNELITKINRGGLSDIASTLPGVKESLYEQSKGLIDVDISAIRPAIAEEIDTFHGKIDKLKEHFSNNKGL